MHNSLTDKCELIILHINVVTEYFSSIQYPSDFKNTKQGQLLLDAILMRLQAIGETVKKIIKIEPGFFDTLSYDTNTIIRFRDFIAHHYEKTDSEIVFDICKCDVPLLQHKITQALNNQ